MVMPGFIDIAESVMLVSMVDVVKYHVKQPLEIAEST
jgi:hypothetical protein